MKTTRRILLTILSTALAGQMNAIPPQVSNISYSQRGDTKLVDIRYDLTLDAGKTAYVEFFFSHDDGVTFPVTCTAVTGAAGAGIASGGGKTAVWNAEVDWNKQFTDEGRIRIKAAYGQGPPRSGGGTSWALHEQSYRSGRGDGYFYFPSPYNVPPPEISVGDQFIINGTTASMWRHIPSGFNFSNGVPIQVTEVETGSNGNVRVVTADTINLNGQSAQGMGASDYKYPAGTVTMDSVSAGTTSFETVEIPFVVGTAAGSPSRGVKDFYEHVIPSFAGISGPPKKYHVDNREVTNAKWDEVVEWSENNGYDLVKAPTGTDPDMPRTRVSILDAIKWCNARSEMEGFTPVYYVDQEEAMEDMNRDGAYTNGPDYVYPRTEEEQQNFDWEKADLNQNLAWDPGEPFIDKNSNGKFDPKEFVDFNQNGKRDTGLTQPYRVGDLTAYVTLNAPWWQDVDTYSQQPWSLHHHEMPKANGYRLPGQGWSDGPEGGSNGAEFYYLAMGGHGENTSVAYKEEWPWGAKAPAGKTDLAKYVVTTIGGNVQSVPLPVGARKPTVEGLYDMIGNVAEWTAEMGILKDTTGPDGGFAGTLSYILEPVGGSCRGLPDGSDTFGWAMNGGFGIPEITPSSVMVAGEHADRNGEPWVGFRSMRIEF